MKVLHLCICGPFTDGLSYQENELIQQHVALGHDVAVIAGTYTYGLNKRVVQTEAGNSLLSCGASLTRLPLAWNKLGWLASKIRAHRGLKTCLETLQPDRILFHGLCAWDLLTVANFARRTPGVKLFADCHEDFHNSAMSWASRELLHRRFYKPIFNTCADAISEILCVTVESLSFAIDFYDSPRAKTRMYPLGSVIESADLHSRRRTDFRTRHGFSDSDIVLTQTGKLDGSKQLPAALLAFRATRSNQLKFIIAGQMTEDVEAACLPLIQGDERISYLGWQSTDELRTVLSGTDFFLQPFGQTVTTQMAMSHGCIILAQDLPSHQWLVGERGKLFKDSGELGAVFEWVLASQIRIPELKRMSLSFAEAHLDYRQLALQIVT